MEGVHVWRVRRILVGCSCRNCRGILRSQYKLCARFFQSESIRIWGLPWIKAIASAHTRRRMGVMGESRLLLPRGDSEKSNSILGSADLEPGRPRGILPICPSYSSRVVVGRPSGWVPKRTGTYPSGGREDPVVGARTHPQKTRHACRGALTDVVTYHDRWSCAN